jgi:polyisoprenoid-binding protein YceI
MRIRLIAALSIAVLMLAAAPRAHAQPAPFTVDPEHFSAGFLVMHIGYAKVLGMFREGTGSFTFDEQRGEVSNIRITLKSASVFSGHQARDEHLRSPDFLNAREFPDIVFVGRQAQRTGERTGRITGDLTVLGRARTVTFDITLNKAAAYPFATGGLFSRPNYVVGISARGAFKRSEFGMTYGVADGLVGDEVEVIIELEGIRR